MQLSYPGPEDGVVLLANGVTYLKGVPTDVPTSEVASLLEQGWTKTKKAAPTKAKPAPVTPEPEAVEAPDVT